MWLIWTLEHMNVNAISSQTFTCYQRSDQPYKQRIKLHVSQVSMQSLLVYNAILWLSSKSNDSILDIFSKTSIHRSVNSYYNKKIVDTLAEQPQIIPLLYQTSSLKLIFQSALCKLAQIEKIFLIFWCNFAEHAEGVALYQFGLLFYLDVFLRSFKYE